MIETEIHTRRPPKNMLEVFDSLPEGTPAQLINNHIIMSPAPSDTHQKVLMDLTNKLYNFLTRQPVGILRIAPYDVYLDVKNVYQPDILFVSEQRKHLIEEKGLIGAPDLVIEILSPHTASYDLDEKMEVYARNGVLEYWIIEPHEKRAKGYELVEKEYQLLSEAIGVLSSKLLNKKFKF